MTITTWCDTGEAAVVPLDDALDEGVTVGAKARNLARAIAAGLPVVPGFVIPASASARVAGMANGAVELDEVRRVWSRLSRDGTEALVVRSSSTVEDADASSLAGVFTSVIDVRGWDAFVGAVREVVASGRRGPEGGAMAVLVQRHIDPAWGGVLFGIDPVTGRTDRLVLAAVEGGPDQLVSGAVDGSRRELNRRGRVVGGDDGPAPDRRGCYALATLAKRAAAVFGGPQDIEWAIDRTGRVLLLQSRPVTASPVRADGPLLGPGPVAETFPDPLRPLEAALWVEPLRDAVRTAVALTGGASRRRLEASPVLVTVGGRVAIDLGLVGALPASRRFLAKLDPRPPLRRLRVAWMVGRLGAALPGLAADLVERTDVELGLVPPLGKLRDDELLTLLDRTRDALRAVHGYELLAGALTAARPDDLTAAELALAALRTRPAGIDDETWLAAHPELLVLLPPAIGGRVELPDPGIAQPAKPVPSLTALPAREALRLRARWLHELSARAALTLGQRLATREMLASPDDIVWLDLQSLGATVTEGGGEITLDLRTAAIDEPPLPAAFRLAADGRAVAAIVSDGERGVGAGGGRASGVAHHELDPPAGAVLVVAALDPRLAPVLERLSGLVAETGSVLSHLAILAREHGVATVVGVPDARRRFPPGTRLLVDGTTGTITALAPEGVHQ